MCRYTVHIQCVWGLPLTLHGHIVNRELQALPTAHHLHRVPFIVIQLLPCEQSLRSFTCRERGPKSHTTASFLFYQYSPVYLTGLLLSLTHTHTHTHTHTNTELTGHIYKLKHFQREYPRAYLHIQTHSFTFHTTRRPHKTYITDMLLKENRDAYICCSANSFCEAL